MIESLKFILEAECQLSVDRTILVGVSGGPDSLCLLDILTKLDYPLVVAHLDHSLRPGSADDSLRVASFARSIDAPYYSERVDVHNHAEIHQLSIEEAGREVRYGYLFRLAQELDAQAVAVGHNADDQVETVLMHLLRGSGLAGLRGMSYRSLPNPWQDDIPLVRPLLGVWREQILDYVERENLQPLVDESNVDTRFYRNRLRHELLPYLEGYNPQVRRLLWRTANSLADDYDIIISEVSQAWDDCLRVSGDEYLGFSLKTLTGYKSGVVRHLLRRGIGKLRPDLRDIDYSAIQRASEFINSPPRSRQIDLLADLRLMAEGDLLWLFTSEADLPHEEWPQFTGDGELVLNIPGDVHICGGWSLLSENLTNIEEAHHLAVANQDLFQAYIDAGQLSETLIVRLRQPGDRFQPLGMGGKSMKLSDFMLNEKIPARARKSWPILTSGRKILWVPGYRIAHPFRVRDGSREVLRLLLYKK